MHDMTNATYPKFRSMGGAAPQPQAIFSFVLSILRWGSSGARRGLPEYALGNEDSPITYGIHNYT